MKKVLILVNHDVVIYNFRKELVQLLIENNYKVYISSPYGKKIDLLVNLGCEYINTPIDRHGTNLIDDIKLVSQYRKLIKQIKPDIVLSYTIKPNIYGGLACRSLNVPYIATITGLGTAFEKEGIFPKLILKLYKLAFKKVHKIFFQNESNMLFFRRNKISISKHRLVSGSGVNLDEFYYTEYPKYSQNIRLLFVGRVMKEKGIEELTKAAEVLSNEKGVIFDAVGFYEKDYEEKAKELERLNIVNFHGVQSNVQEFIKQSHAVILPSYHEGMANVLLEASSMGRPIIASSIPGCKEIFDEGVTGFGVEPKSVDSIIKVVRKFIELPYHKKRTMGIKAREKVKREFDRNKVVLSYMEEIKTAIEKR